ncbi:alkaline phosphatase family protein [Natronoglomus mannanivorans]|uniref:Alkaline phosphatase family protein n=1 Tax=Natronoglomus mannanivorans TaxID=2979990 RepID=A0AAP2Z0J3_9EURY|nr:alkaline phosphatase family protein [Halobacteria archaeon AArc-xg1-1]
MSDSTRMDTLLIGIDAGCLPVFERLFADGRIPTIERLCTDGACGPLESQIPPWTPSAWPSLYTGTNPGKHGATGFVHYDGYDWHVTGRDDVEEHSLWSLLDVQGYSSVVVNVPVTHPPDEIDGAVVPGFIGPEDPQCHPEGTLEELREAIGEYRVYPNYTRGDDEVSDAEKMAEYRTLVRMRGEAFRYLADRHDPDFGFVQFQKTDTVFHEFDGDEEKVASVYEATDAQIAEILEECDPKRVFIASDHGMGPYEEYEFRVNEFLREEGYVTVTTNGKGMPSWNPIRHQLRQGNDERTWEPSTFERLAGTAASFGLTARRARRALEAVHLDGLAMKYVPKNVARTANEQVDFEQSIAYLRARTELGVRINLEGREPNGVVSPEEYDDVRAALIRDLESVQTPDGDPVFAEVTPREQYFHGKNAEKAVDVVTIPNDFRFFLSDQLAGDYFAPPTESWNHKLDGVFVASGEGIDTDAPLRDAHLFDVAPTIMAALGVPYSDRMDGSVLPVVERSDVRSNAYPEYGRNEDGEADPAGSDEPTDQVENRLADLGYLG